MAGAPRSCRYVPPLAAFTVLRRVWAQAYVGVRRLWEGGGGCKINKSLLNWSVNTDLCAGSEERSAVEGEGVLGRRNSGLAASFLVVVRGASLRLLLNHYTATGLESAAFRGESAYMVGEGGRS